MSARKAAKLAPQGTPEAQPSAREKRAVPAYAGARALKLSVAHAVETADVHAHVLQMTEERAQLAGRAYIGRGASVRPTLSPSTR